VGGNRQILLKDISQPDQAALGGYEKRGGYAALRKALEMDPLKVVEEVKNSGLVGRGGAAFPTGVKWGFLPRGAGKPA
jgi:NADH-quinone oxidoreductase subunit F